MKNFFWSVCLLLAACGSETETTTATAEPGTTVAQQEPLKDTVTVVKEVETPSPEPGETDLPVDTGKKKVQDNPVQPALSNKRFRKVRIEKTGKDTYRVSGQGQIFEASFGWVIEDGHNELRSGFEMTDAGAPEWGNFSFTVSRPGGTAGKTLHLILFETSAKDGSRQHELPIRLPD